ncbi:MAG: NAD(P)-binding domain-containing protein [Betaproteobacteria bacterium]
MNIDSTVIYLGPLVLAFLSYGVIRSRRGRRDSQRHQEAVAAGLTEPASLHPVFDTARCIGSSACVSACPEHAIGIVEGKAQLINPAVCIGHGACQATCPMDAIKLVFGTEKRGIDIPQVDPAFETNVPGIFIAGELGGMGLIHKAVEQGHQAINTIAQRRAKDNMLDVVIVGAGPAGLGAALAAQEKRLRFAILEQEVSLGGTVYHYPRNKIAMTSPMQVPMFGRIKFGEVRKEALLKFWLDAIRKAALKVNFRERVDAIDKVDGGFMVKTATRNYVARSVLLSIGRRGTPRRLAVPGEDRSKVVYRLVDPAQYRGQHVLVVGGGDAAIEAAVAVSEEPGTTVSLSYRGAAFNRIKPANQARLQNAEKTGRLRILLESDAMAIFSDKVVLKRENKAFSIRNDAVIVCAGGLLPTQFLRDLGILVETRHGTA